jgi:hypothetical protein
MRFDTSDLATFQSVFLRTITGNAPAHPALRIYHDTCQLGRIDTLSATFDITQKALGHDAFKAFARDFVREHLPASGNMATYGAGFADYLDTHPHSPGWLPDLVRFEWALHHAHNADDANPCDFGDLLDPANAIALHPSVQILATVFDTAALYTAVRDTADLPDIAPAPQTWLIGRTPADDVIWQTLSPFEADFIARIMRTRSLLIPLEQLSPDADEMTLLQTLLARLVTHGLLILTET